MAPRRTRNERVLVLDCGPKFIRVGWADDTSPRVVVPCLVVKNRAGSIKGDPSSNIRVGNEVVQSDIERGIAKSGYEGDIIVDVSTIEKILDYAFTKLQLRTTLAETPVIVTETFVNIPASRQMLHTLLTTVYGATKVYYVVDALASLAALVPHPTAGLSVDTLPIQDTLLIHIGVHSTIVAPVLDGKVHFTSSRRVPIGHYHMVTLLHSLLATRLNAIATPSVFECESILTSWGYVATDYDAELEKYAEMLRGYEPNTNVTPASRGEPGLVSYTPVPYPLAKEVDTSAQEKKRADAAERMALMREDQRKRKAEAEEKLKDEDAKKYEEVKQRQQAEAERRQQKRARLEEEEQNIRDNLDAHLAGLRAKHSALCRKVREFEKKKKNLGARGSAASRERLELIAKQTADSDDDDFGADDNDWSVYIQINPQELDEKIMALKEELEGVVAEIRRWDETFVNREPFIESLSVPEQTLVGDFGDPKKIYRYPLSYERVAPAELLFKPYLLGSRSAGVSESIGFILQTLPQSTHLRLGSVSVVGTGADIPGLTARLTRELGCILPYSPDPQVSVAIGEGAGAGWVGAARVASVLNGVGSDVVRLGAFGNER